MNVIQIFCDADDFCQEFIPNWQKTLLNEGETKTRVRARSVCESEIIAVIVCFHASGYRTFKWFYTRHVQKFWLREFPGLPSYNRFVEIMADILIPIAAFMQSRCGMGKALPLSTRHRYAFAKISASLGIRLSIMWQGVASLQRAGFTVLNFI